MNWKRNSWTLLVAGLFVAGFTNCSDWTETENEWVLESQNTETNKPESYYQNLRAWKASDHAISFGWYSGWGEPTVSTTNMLAGIPDSMDIVSLWGNWSNLSEGKIKDLREVQQKKGTRVIFCSFTSYVGQNFTPAEYDTDEASRNEFWGWKDGDSEAIDAAIAKYAKAIADTVFKYNYDGFDIDFEPNYGYGGPLASDMGRMHTLLTELNKYIGPQSPNPDKLLIVDGEPQTLNAESGPLIDYFVVQAYTVSGGSPSPNATGYESDKDDRLQRCLNKFLSVMSEKEITNRYVICENLESAMDALNGGFYWVFRDGTKADKSKIPSLVGMAMWEPTNGFRKGGFGAYQFGYEAMNSPSYKWMRTAIAAQLALENPETPEAGN